MSTVYIGGYAPGLAVGRADPPDGELALTATVPDVPDASFLAFALNRRVLYTTNERAPVGSVTALDLTDPQAPVVLNREASLGAGPAHLSVHTSGRFLLTANYVSGTVAVHRLEPDGRIGTATDLLELGGDEPHAHQVLTDPSGRWVLSVDLGGDAVHVHRLNLANGTLESRERLCLAAGTGPRHLTFHPHGRYVYVLGENRPEITVAGWDAATGHLTAGQVVPAAQPGSFPAEIVACRDGRHVYVTNRGENTIATFGVGSATLIPLDTVSTGGDWPRHLTLSPDERWVFAANQRSGTITRLPRDPETGRLGAPVDPVLVTNPAVILFH